MLRVVHVCRTGCRDARSLSSVLLRPRDVILKNDVRRLQKCLWWER